MLNRNKKQQGFTIIELLVVVSIIGLLSSIMVVTARSSRAKARDNQRVQNLQQIQRSLEIYAANNGGAYPTLAGGAPGSYFASSNPNAATYWTPLQTALSPYVTLPVTDASYSYVYANGPMMPCMTFTGPQGVMRLESNGYYLQVTLENQSEISMRDGGLRPNVYEIFGGNYQYHAMVNGPFLGWPGC
jgi:prepilin-type N-terminal cleavage/methylation domain-containing protein